MTALLESLTSNKDLRILRVNDNWIKNKATEKLLGVIISCT